MFGCHPGPGLGSERPPLLYYLHSSELHKTKNGSGSRLSHFFNTLTERLGPPRPKASSHSSTESIGRQNNLSHTPMSGQRGCLCKPLASVPESTTVAWAHHQGPAVPDPLRPLGLPRSGHSRRPMLLRWISAFPTSSNQRLNWIPNFSSIFQYFSQG